MEEEIDAATQSVF
jgi:hypothetical protein